MNWGNKLLLTFLVFAGGMGFLVYRSVKTNYELVEKDYYKNEIVYQQVIDGTNRANQLSSQVTIKQNETGITLSFPEEMRNKDVTGVAWFYCSYDQKKDRTISLQLNGDAMQQIPLTALSPGNYTVKIEWGCGGRHYFTEKYFTVL